MDAAASKYLDVFPVLRAFGDLLPDPVIAYLAGLKNLDHPSGIAPAQLETPMMKQFASSKVTAADALLFFRMGDFFELFGLDAVIASLLCRLTLTSRDKGAEDPVPMAGVPVVSYKVAVKKCVEAGFKVAICDQIEDPKDTKLLVRREIVRIITPAVAGDLFDEDESSPAGSFLAAVAFSACAGPASDWTVGALDAATGEFRLVAGVSLQGLHEELLALAPREILLSESDFLPEKKALVALFQKNSVQSVPAILKSTALRNFQIASLEKDLETIYSNSPSAIAEVVAFPGGATVASALFRYIKETQRAAKFHWKPAQIVHRNNTLCLDNATKIHLNLLSGDGRRHSKSFFDFLNHCATAHGRRKLYDRLSAPYVHRSEIEKSLNLIESLLSCRPGFLSELRSKLAACADLDRILSRLVQNQAAHKELIALRRTLRAAIEIAFLLESEFSSQNVASALFESLCPKGCFFERTELLAELDAALAESGFSAALVGGALGGSGQEAGSGAGSLNSGRSLFNLGYNAQLDELLKASSTIEADLAALQSREREKSGIATLKVGFNKVFGYFIEVSKGRADKVPAHFVRKQTLANAERFITQELKELEEFSLNAEDNRLLLEKEIFAHLVAKVLECASRLSELNERIAFIDLQLCLAKVSDLYRFVKPTISESPVTLLRGVVHPVVAAEMQRLGQGFVPNDLAFGKASSEAHSEPVAETGSGGALCAEAQFLKPILLITGPNMAGKSTIMRQVAIVHILAQMGCYVPCSSAQVGICDAIFTRIGASDDLLGARSTFMVEMSETAQILKQLTPRSLILMDEIGRGTSTFDGLSLAWSILEELDGNASPRTLFSTHYHELSASCDSLQNTRPMQIEVLENPSALDEDDAILFTHRLVEGAARESYGIHVARMAGLPKRVLDRAAAKLQHLIQSRNDGSHSRVPQLFSGLPDVQVVDFDSKAAANMVPDSLLLLEELKNLDLDQLTPLQIMNLCAGWQKKLRQSRGSKPKKVAATLQTHHLMEPLF